jgi:hypothetical protein
MKTFPVVTLLSTLCFFLLISSAHADIEWETGDIDAPERFDATSLKIAADGTQYLAFGGDGTSSFTSGDNLMLATRSPGGQWQIETVDTAPVGAVGLSPSLALDNNGHPRISYYDQINRSLKYASSNGSAWVLETVDIIPGGSAVGQFSSLALDSSDSPRISYNGANYIKYASFNGTGWDIEDVYFSNTKGHHSSLALDNNNNPHISYYESLGDDLRYSHYNGTSWSHQLLDDVGNVGEYNSLALDSTGSPRISYYDASNKDLKYASWNGATWDISTLASTNDVGKYSSLALNSSDYYRISYWDQTNDRLWVTANGPLGLALVYDELGGTFTSLTLDASEKVAVSYKVNETGELKVVDFSPTLTKSTVTVYGDPAIVNGSLALDTSDTPGVAYSDQNQQIGAQTFNKIQYARFNGLSWDTETVAVTPAVNYDNPSLTYDSNGNPLICYVDVTNRDLKLATRVGSSWNNATVNNTDLIGLYSSIAVDTNNIPHISYVDQTNPASHSLKYTFWNGSSWTVEPIITVGDVTTISSIALTSANVPVIAFYHAANNTLNVASRGGPSSWGVLTVDPSVGTVTVPLDISLAIDTDDHIHISYYDRDNDTLKYATYNGTSWSTQAVEATENKAYQHAIAVDRDGRPGISYYDASIHEYKYASFNGSSWDLHTVADYAPNPSGATIRQNSVAIDSQGKIWIAYMDELKGDLKYVTSKDEATFPWHMFLPAIVHPKE